MMRQKHGYLAGAAIVLMASAGLPVAATAQEASAGGHLAQSMPSQRLSDALRQLAEASGLQLVYDTKITDGKVSAAITGPLPARAALTALLAGTGLSFQFSDDRTVVISASPAESTPGETDGVRAVGVVNVEGTGHMPYGQMASPVNGVNGSRDVEATEGTGSYTTGAISIVSKIPQTLRETAQSVSVITTQQLQDQSLLSIKDTLAAMAGTTATPGSSNTEFNIYSRGFLINAYAFDGGAAIVYDQNNRPVLDMSEFDSVQLVRGANGEFGGFGDPGGTVNLVRKKPLDHRQITYSQDIGSFNHFREELDVTDPLTANHKLRARAVFAREDRDFFYDTANSHKFSAYGVLEYDLTPRTLVDLGVNFVHERNLPNVSGLPRYANGNAIDFPISTCFCVPWNHDWAGRSEIYLTIDRKITDNISSKLSATYNYQKVDSLDVGQASLIYDNGIQNAILAGSGSINPTRQYGIDYSLNGMFKILGRRNLFTFGGSWRYTNADGAQNFVGTAPRYTIVDIFHFDPSQYPAPVNLVPDSILLINHEFEFGVYGNIKFELFKWLHLATSMRYSGLTQRGTNLYPGTGGRPDKIQVANPLRARGKVQPNISGTLDLPHHFALYGSHQEIYQVQGATRNAPLGDFIPPPITGFNDEAGVKWESVNRRLNASLGLYNIRKDGILQYDQKSGTIIPLLQNYTSRGFDFEVTGELFTGLQVSGSYAYNKNDRTTTNATTLAITDIPIASFQPRNIVKSFVVYRGTHGFLNRFILGGGVNYQSSAYTSGSVCKDAVVTSKCVTGKALYAFTTPGYSTLELKAGYQLSRQFELSLDAKNVTNVKAYAAMPFQQLQAYNFYVEPFNILASLHAKW